MNTAEHHRHLMTARAALVEAWRAHNPEAVAEAWEAISHHMDACKRIERGEPVKCRKCDHEMLIDDERGWGWRVWCPEHRDLESWGDTRAEAIDQHNGRVQ
jgi:hypothetical protein